MNKEIIEVTICAGTHCYLMGGSELQLLGEYLPDELKEKVKIKGSPCLDFCNTPGAGKPPYVLVNKRPVCQANIQLIINEIRSELNNRKE